MGAGVGSSHPLWRLLQTVADGAGPVPTGWTAIDSAARLASALGDPQDGLPVIHIAGSKGKGSSAIFTEAILRAAGLRTGLFLSPHLSDWRERFQIDAEPADDALLREIADRLQRRVDSGQAGNARFFELATVAGLCLFEQAGVDCAIVETGIGGRDDATNIVQPLCVCITAIELEHQDRLGTTEAQIAAHKAGIIKSGVPVVLAPIGEAARAVIEREAARRAARLHMVDPSPDWQLPHLGPHAALAAELAVNCVAQSGLVDETRARWIARRCLPNTPLPARCEMLGGRPRRLVDSAHTAASARDLNQVLDRLTSKRRFVLSLSQGKDYAAFLRALLRPGDQVLATRADSDRSLDADALAEQVRTLVPGVAIATIDEDRKSVV